MNRSPFLIRLLRYYAHSSFRGTICIADSSNPEHVALTKSAINALGGKLDIVYREYPNVNTALCFKRLIEFVTTPYAAYVADDDFLVPNCMDRCMVFLDENPDYIAAHGKSAMVGLDTEGAYGPVSVMSPYAQTVASAEAGAQRLTQYLNDYSVSIFSVFRVSTWRAMVRDITPDMDLSFSGELLPSCIAIVQGKVKELNSLYLIRQIHRRRYVLPSVFEWITSPKWQTSYEIFRDSLSQELVRQDGINLVTAQETVQNAFLLYLIKRLPKSLDAHYRRQDSASFHGLRKALRCLPGLRYSWHTLRSFLPGDANALTLPALNRSLSRYHRDFMPISHSLTTPPMEPSTPEMAHLDRS